MAKRTQREDGRYSAKISTGDGKYKYIYAPTEKELEKKIREVEKRRDRGLDLAADRDSFGYWREKWLRLKMVEVSSARYTSYLGKSKYLDSIAHIPISKIRADDVQDIILDLAINKNMAKQTLNEIKQVASQIVRLAMDNRVVEYNCVSAVKIPSAAPKDSREAITEEQISWVENTPHRAQTAAMIMLYAGLRRGELIPLKWCDIDFDNMVITVNKSVERVNGSMQLKKGGKSKAAERKVYIPQKLVSYLKPLRGAPFELVCPSARGKLMSDTAWRRMWESYMCDLNIKYGKWENQINGSETPKNKYVPEKLPTVIETFTAHQLRHTYITMLYMAGVDVLTAKEQAGHADIKTTLGIYTHLNAEYKLHNLYKFDEYLGKKENEQGCQFGCQIN